MTPAEELRAAAKAIRERAEAATPGPWFPRGDGDWYVCSEGYGLVTTGIHDEPGGGHLVMLERDHRDATHIASWHPLVALAVADFLDAAGNDACAAVMRDDGEPDLNWCDEPGTIVQALRIARAYTGGTS